MNRKTRILFVSHEMLPYVHLSDIAKAALELPKSMQERGMEIRILTPRYGCISERRHRLHEVVRLSGINISVGDNDSPLVIKVASLPNVRMQVYFLDNEDYFHRKNVFHDDAGTFFGDNHERMIFFNKGVMETVMKLGWAPDLVHCSGWMCGLIPLYIRKFYKNTAVFRESRVVFSAYESQFKENLHPDFFEKACMEDVTPEDFSTYGQLTDRELQMGAISYADAVVLANNKVHPDVIKAAHDSGKPLLNGHNQDHLAESHFDFYQQILAELPINA